MKQLTSKVTLKTLPTVSASQDGKSKCTGPGVLFCGIGLATGTVDVDAGAGLGVGVGVVGFFTGGGVGWGRGMFFSKSDTGGGGVDLEEEACGPGEEDGPGALVVLAAERVP